ncbi:uncharacterized protein PV09_07938 [Verruconis gallopava]|uniref:NADH:flavin oxidoreductase/NADH oxidase N-terminal domain-containing protein n=1 Tax=Verruconis gallopava TaxID=253628 RepID=A0A0D2A2L0_9PEZI|nr:uncharacterized protein PV09_07938 [Verruconis gallopava]KIW00585.1 hypothetical protein PV09_07938 [Verruconis gallopava]
MATAYNTNAPVQGISFFTPKHKDSPGAVINPNEKTPTLFKPLKIRNVTLRNRIIVAPMCQYSTAPDGPEIGKLTPYHIATLGHYALKGASLVFIEATGVQPNGRITPNCPGLWSDDQTDGVRKVAEFIKSQGALCGIQLAHAGRKGSTVAPWLSSRLRQPSNKAPKEVGGWPDNVVGPMGGEGELWDGKSYDKSGYYPPRQLSTDEVKQISKDFAAAARRSVEAGVDVIEIHGAHGYLIHQFLSPITNRRNDEYGGSFENRTRLLFETIKAVREVIPASMPLFLRLSSTEWMETSDLAKQYGSWDVESTIRVAKQLPSLGVDLLDVSSGGNHPKQSVNMFLSKDYQTRIAARIRKEIHAEGLNLLIGAVGLITEAEQARDIVQEAATPVAQSGKSAPVNNERECIAEEVKAAVKMTEGNEPMADAILVARQFMREPEWVLKVAWQLGVDVAWPSQFLRSRFPKL